MFYVGGMEWRRGVGSRTMGVRKPRHKTTWGLGGLGKAILLCSHRAEGLNGIYHGGIFWGPWGLVRTLCSQLYSLRWAKG